MSKIKLIFGIKYIKTLRVPQVTEDISKYGNKTFKENSKQNLKVTEKLQEFYGLDDVNEAKELLNTIQSKRIEINELDLNKSEDELKTIFGEELYSKVKDDIKPFIGKKGLEAKKAVEDPTKTTKFKANGEYSNK